MTQPNRPMLGLALSGGGFRASFFHIGVLARLADLDLLRKVEVISTVSGGSIIGALYYLHLKGLLESKPDREITADDYRRLVADMAESFTTAVQKNLRMRTFIDPIKNLRMSQANYSRSDRIGELFDRYLYRPVVGGQGPVLMRDLKIQPAEEKSGFHPEHHNGERRAKVPILLINATSLNTGRNWRFEAVRMGEPPPQGATEEELDKRMRLARPPSYADMTPVQQDIELGLAVAASAAVPGIFNPLAISKLYPDTRVELVDGGVHDNQGVQALIDRGCTRFVISDGSGQMEGIHHPATSILSVLLRSSSISMSRVREEQVLRSAERAGATDVCLIHLRQGLAPEHIPYIDDKGQVAKLPKAPASETLARYRIDPEVQDALSRLRTDLDAFSDMEAHSLMLSGYRLTAYQLGERRRLSGLHGGAGNSRQMEQAWFFDDVAELMERPTERYLRVLKVGSSVAFKVFGLSQTLRALTLLVLGVALSWTLWTFRNALDDPVVPISWVPTRQQVIIFLLAAALAASGRLRWLAAQVSWVRKTVNWVRFPMRWLGRTLLRAIPLALGSVFFALYLWLATPFYLRAGRIDGGSSGPPLKSPVGRRAAGSG